jgi:hypothetical protein
MSQNFSPHTRMLHAWSSYWLRLSQQMSTNYVAPGILILPPIYKSSSLLGGHAVMQLVEARRYKPIPEGVIGIFH